MPSSVRADVRSQQSRDLLLLRGHSMVLSPTSLGEAHGSARKRIANIHTSGLSTGHCRQRQNGSDLHRGPPSGLGHCYLQWHQAASHFARSAREPYSGAPPHHPTPHPSLHPARRTSPNPLFVTAVQTTSATKRAHACAPSARVPCKWKQGAEPPSPASPPHAAFAWASASSAAPPTGPR